MTNDQRTVQSSSAQAPDCRPGAAGPLPVDPALGLLETMLVRGGRVVRIDRHLMRLQASVAALYGRGSPTDVRSRVMEGAREVGTAGVVRLLVWPSVGGLEVEVQCGPPRERPLPVELVAVPFPGGLGAHKWRDRRALSGMVTGERTPLLVDGDGCVLEAGFANLFLERDGLLLTPPASGRVLPGITRAALIEAARTNGIGVLEWPLTLDDALDAEHLFLTSALCGVAPAVLQGARANGDRRRAQELTQLLERSVPA
jgi:para-aminobenzoate synthetase/4-amino-4-deoxychorismate lyase